MFGISPEPVFLSQLPRISGGVTLAALGRMHGKAAPR